MKKFNLCLVAALALSASATLSAQSVKPEDFTFETVKENPVTPVKNQFRSGTCWCFSTLSFVESEIIRLNKIKDASQYPDLSEMFVVSKSYQDRAEKYIRLEGHLNFAAGSEADDVLDVIRTYGIVPQAAQPGLTEKPEHGELDAVTKSFVETVNKTKGKLRPNWKSAFKGIVDSYLGECPTEFVVDGKTYTPESYRDALKFNPDDYITLTSFSHHPFYTWFSIEVCDNWRGDLAYNVPIDEFIEALDYALDHGYTACWGTDVSETGFTRNGIAVLLDEAPKSAVGSDQERWVGKDSSAPAVGAGKNNLVEIVPTQEYRQETFDNRTTTDDHGMHIYGTAKDQNGTKFYIVKNSWGPAGAYKGIWYASENFVRGKSLDILIHKDALPKALRKRLGL